MTFDDKHLREPARWIVKRLLLPYTDERLSLITDAAIEHFGLDDSGSETALLLAIVRELLGDNWQLPANWPDDYDDDEYLLDDDGSVEDEW